MYYNNYTTNNFTDAMNGTKYAADYPAFTGKVAKASAGVWVGSVVRKMIRGNIFIWTCLNYIINLLIG